VQKAANGGKHDEDVLEEARECGWDIATATEPEFAGFLVFQTGPCGTHSAIAIEPGGSITIDDKGNIGLNGVIFLGEKVKHIPECPYYETFREEED
jgi:hypothetical protein